MKKFNVRIVIYFDYMLLISFSLKDLLMVSDTLMLSIQHLRFLIKIKKSYPKPTLILESFKVIVDSVEMSLSLLKGEVFKFQNNARKSQKMSK